jgi:hypothetical protein
MTIPISFSFGSSTFDNLPLQLTLDSTEQFFDWLTTDRSIEKGQKYICAPLLVGPHNRSDQYLGEATWRLKRLATNRRFIAFDIDHFDNPDDFNRLQTYLTRWQSIYYTTASHTPERPRARAILILGENLGPDDAESLCKVIELEIKMALGDGMLFDQSVYRASQPIYTPLANALYWVSTEGPLNVTSYRHLIDKRTQVPCSVLPGRKLTGQPTPIGGRNATLLSAVGRWRSAGLTEEEISQLAIAVNQTHFEAPLDDDEVASVCSRYAHQTAAAPAQLTLGGGVSTSWLTVGNCSIPTVSPPPREYVFGHTITPGTLSVLGGSGGVSKTMLAMQICAASACGSGLGELQVADGCSMLLLGEEDEAERDRRLGGICSYFGLDVSRVERRVLSIGAAGIDIRMTQKFEANSHATALGDQVIETAIAHAEQCGVPLRFIVIDHARLVLGGDPNNAEDVTQLTRVLTNIARQTGAAVLLIAHSPKSVLSKAGNEINAADIAGSSAFVDNGRTAFMAYGMREEEAKRHYVPESERHNWVRVQNVKANYARSGLGWWFNRVVVADWEIAVLEYQALATVEEFTPNKRANLQRKILDHLRAHPGSSKRALRDRAGRKGVFGVSDRELMSEINEMLETGLLTARAPTPEERRAWRLTGQVREVVISNAPC